MRVKIISTVGKKKTMTTMLVVNGMNFDLHNFQTLFSTAIDDI